MSERGAPAMSVVLVTPARYESIRGTIGHLRAQTVRDRLEVVIVTPSADELRLDRAELAGFAGIRVVEVGAIRSLAQTYAAGIRAAAAPVVALGEDHAYPDPDWADALIRAHRRPWAAVGPAMRNANPGSAVSWADFFIAYARWMDPMAAQVIDHLPGHNSSYKRAVLLEYGPDLEPILEAESILHWDLRARGHQLYLEPGAKTSHANFTSLSSWIPSKFYSGRVFAATRARGGRWSRPRHLLYAGGAPLIPLVRLRRLTREAGRARQLRVLVRVLPLVIAGLAMSASGEMVGYAVGAGDAMRKLCFLEFRPERAAAALTAELQPVRHAT